MIEQVGSVYEIHRVYLLKNGIDQTENIVLRGTWTYSSEEKGFLYNSEGAGGMYSIEFPIQYITKRYMYIECRAMTSAANYSFNHVKNGVIWTTNPFTNSNNDNLGNNNGFNYTNIYGRRGCVRWSTNLLLQSFASTDSVGVNKTFNTVRVYNVYLSDYTNDYISKTPNLS